jgi:hypothetical protein
MRARHWTTLTLFIEAGILQAQILQYHFDEGVGATSLSIGTLKARLLLRDTGGTPTSALWGAPGSGPSGSSSDRALELTSAGGMGSGFTGPNAYLASLGTAPALDRFTITGWIRPTTTDLNRAQLLRIENYDQNLWITGLAGGPAGMSRR